MGEVSENTDCFHGNEKKTGSALLFHDVFDFGGSVLRQLQVEDPLHEHLSVAVKIQRVCVADDLIVRVRVQQHRHVAASSPHLNITERRVKFVHLFQCITFFLHKKMLRIF